MGHPGNDKPTENFSPGEGLGDANRRTTCGQLKHILMDNALLILSLLGVCLGFAIGFGSRGYITPDGLLWLGEYTSQTDRHILNIIMTRLFFDHAI